MPSLSASDPVITSSTAVNSTDAGLSSQEIIDVNALRKLSERLIVKEFTSDAPSSGSSSSGGIAAGFASVFSSKQKAVSATLVTPGADPEYGASEGSKTSGFVLVKEKRRIIKHGEVDVCGKGLLWNVKNPKYLFLLSDVLLVTTVKGKLFYLETVIDYRVCKLDANPRATLGNQESDLSNRFDIRWPGGILEILFKTAVQKEEWSRCMQDTICHCVFVDQGTLSFGWRHVYMYGTVHSAVISGDEPTLMGIISSCKAGNCEFSLLDSLDEDGFSALHLSCILRLRKISELLLNSDADCTLRDGR